MKTINCCRGIERICVFIIKIFQLFAYLNIFIIEVGSIKKLKNKKRKVGSKKTI